MTTSLSEGMYCMIDPLVNYLESGRGGKGNNTRFPLPSIHNACLRSSMLSSPALWTVIISGGVCVNPGPTFNVVFAFGGGGIVGRGSPGNTNIVDSADLLKVVL